MIKRLIGRNPDGTDRFDFELTQDEHDAGMVAFLTGPIGGMIPMPDGTAYDVTDFAIAVHRDHVPHLHIAIHRAHHAAGRFLDIPVPDHAAVSLDTPAAKPRAKRAAKPKT